jgi:hypothetical protein
MKMLAYVIVVAAMAAIFAIPAFLRALRAYGSRSSVLSPLLWFAFLLLAAVIGGVLAGAPFWIEVTVLSLFAIDSVVILVMYVVFFVKGQAHQLRSETYAIQHMALERGLLGDNTVGLIPPPPEGSDILPASEVESPALLLESGDKDDSDGN